MLSTILFITQLQPDSAFRLISEFLREAPFSLVVPSSYPSLNTLFKTHRSHEANHEKSECLAPTVFNGIRRSLRLLYSLVSERQIICDGDHYRKLLMLIIPTCMSEIYASSLGTLPSENESRASSRNIGTFISRLFTSLRSLRHYRSHLFSVFAMCSYRETSRNHHNFRASQDYQRVYTPFIGRRTMFFSLGLGVRDSD